MFPILYYHILKNQVTSQRMYKGPGEFYYFGCATPYRTYMQEELNNNIFFSN